MYTDDNYSMPEASKNLSMSMSFLQQLSIRRNIEDFEEQSDDSFHNQTPAQKFKKIHDLKALVLLGLGATIGSGVFTLTGIAAKVAGQAVFIAFIISGLIALLTAYTFAEFASIIPKSGSSYLYTYVTFGELPAWVVGWNQNLRYGGGCSLQARSWAYYVVQLLAYFGIILPKWLYSYKMFGIDTCPFAVIFLVVLTKISTMGSKTSGDFNFFFTYGKLIILAFITFVAICNFDRNNYDNFL